MASDHTIESYMRIRDICVESTSAGTKFAPNGVHRTQLANIVAIASAAIEAMENAPETAA